MNYHDKIFQPVSNSENGEVDGETFFHYKQKGNILTCTYSGNSILQGHLIGLVNEAREIDMRYHQVNIKGELMTGICRSVPKVENGQLFLYETWEWTSGDRSKGNSILKEVTKQDQRDKLTENPFSYKITKGDKVLIYRNNKQIKLISKKPAIAFIQLTQTGSEMDIQLALAKLTGHYKHGNER